MTKILAFAEERGGKIKKSSLETIRAGRRLADELGGECVALVAGAGVTGAAAGLGRFGAARGIAVDDPTLAQHSNTAVAKIIAAVARSEGAAVIVLPASQMGKDIAPRVAVKLEAGLASDCVALRVEAGDLIATRPVFAGKALLDVRVKTPVKVFTLRPNIFDAAEGGADAPVESKSFSLDPADTVTVVK